MKIACTSGRHRGGSTTAVDGPAAGRPVANGLAANGPTAAGPAADRPGTAEPAARRIPARAITLAVAAGLFSSACGGDPAGRTVEPAGDPLRPTQTEASEPASFPELSERSPQSASMPPGFEGGRWADVLRAADGRSVDWYLWGGDERINHWARSYVADLAAGRYGIEVNIVPVADTADAVAVVLAEKAAGRDQEGAVDLIWVNGENFRALRTADALYGPWTAAAPSGRFLDIDDPLNAFDFGVPVDGYELPWGRSHFVMIHDTARTAAPPTSIEELFEHARANPGTLTYPAPPDFTGSAFVRQVCIDTLGAEALADPAGAADPTVLEPCAERLREIKPFLWRGGETFPASIAQLDELFADGEVDFSMSFNPAAASQRIEDGRFSETARSFVFDSGTLANSHFLAIPYNAADAPAAMVLANFLVSPEAQYAKAQPSVWGDPSVLELNRLEPVWAATFADLPIGPATLSPETLAASRLDEPGVEWIDAIEAMWETEVLAP